jgi:hypothetical protein
MDHCVPVNHHTFIQEFHHVLNLSAPVNDITKVSHVLLQTGYTVILQLIPSVLYENSTVHI